MKLMTKKRIKGTEGAVPLPLLLTTTMMMQRLKKKAPRNLSGQQQECAPKNELEVDLLKD
jgi:hypothetical protein